LGRRRHGGANERILSFTRPPQLPLVLSGNLRFLSNLFCVDGGLRFSRKGYISRLAHAREFAEALIRERRPLRLLLIACAFLQVLLEDLIYVLHKKQKRGTAAVAIALRRVRQSRCGPRSSFVMELMMALDLLQFVLRHGNVLRQILQRSDVRSIPPTDSRGPLFRICFN